MSLSSHFDTVIGFKVLNRRESVLEEDLLTSMDPIITSSHINRIYQEISVTFLLISLVSDQVDTRGTIRMSDGSGHGDDKLCSISWASPVQLWGHMISPVPVSSGELGTRLRIRCYSGSSSYAEGAPLAFIRLLLRIGLRPPVVPLGNVFRWPSSESFSADVFSNIRLQDEMLRSVAGYYSRSDPENPSVWESMEGFYLDTNIMDFSSLIMEVFPALMGGMRCWPYFINFRCQDASNRFHDLGVNMIREVYMRKTRWDECQVLNLFDRLRGSWITDVHFTHTQQYGHGSVVPLVRACASVRKCWKCSSYGKSRETDIFYAVGDLMKSRHGTPLRLGGLMEKMSLMLENSGVLPVWMSALLRTTQLLPPTHARQVTDTEV